MSGADPLGRRHDASASLSAAEARVVDAAWEKAATVPPARRMQGVGCVVAFLGMAALTLTPALGNYVDLGADTAYGILALAVVLLLVGATLGLVAAGRDTTGRDALAAALARVVEAHAADDPSLLAAATVLLARMRDAGPRDGAIDLAGRLGPALADVARVQAYLIRQGRLPPGSR